MSDALQKRIPVTHAEYCYDEAGDVRLDTAMHNWMWIRSSGPNVLKDNTFCGYTNVECLDVENAMVPKEFHTFIGSSPIQGATTAPLFNILTYNNLINHYSAHNYH